MNLKSICNFNPVILVYGCVMFLQIDYSIIQYELAKISYIQTPFFFTQKYMSEQDDTNDYLNN